MGALMEGDSRIESIINDIEETSTYSLHTNKDLFEWIRNRNESLHVSLRNISLDECSPWYYDCGEGCIRNGDGTFFKIYGLEQYINGHLTVEQPIIEQPEIGFLGIITCKIEGVWHYLMQAKIEPGNVNVVQLSPTLQATKSNFTCKHGGRAPKYLEHFLTMKKEDIIVDQIQSEQSSRFLKKRNRNVIIKIQHPIEEPDSHRWMTLGQIKEFMHYDNLVNMDTRTVLSCIPYVLMGQEGDAPFKDKPYFFRTAWSMNRKTIVEIYKEINDYKMLVDNRVEKKALFSLEHWKMVNNEFCHCDHYPFRVIFSDIYIEGREVTNWKQPLFASNGKALFGLFCCDDEGVMKFLVKVRPEPGCFDGIEIGPTIQQEANTETIYDDVEHCFLKKLKNKTNIISNCILSEEGGRFYQEENHNVIIQIDKGEIDSLPPQYIWSDYGTLNILTQVNNCLNIQLRNLLSLLEI